MPKIWEFIRGCLGIYIYNLLSKNLFSSVRVFLVLYLLTHFSDRRERDPATANSGFLIFSGSSRILQLVPEVESILFERELLHTYLT